MSETPSRANWVPAPQFFNLNMACSVILRAFEDSGCYLVGSALQGREYRDVDVRLMLGDAAYDALFPGVDPRLAYLDARWSLLCASISSWLREQSKLPVDFQIQQTTYANDKFQGTRSPLGLFLNPNPADHGNTPVAEGA